MNNSDIIKFGFTFLSEDFWGWGCYYYLLNYMKSIRTVAVETCLAIENQPLD